jgi:hypothetical protein
MKNFVIGILTALMIGGWAVAAEEKNGAEVAGIRVSHGMVTVLSDNGTWEEIGSVSALKAAMQEYDSPAIEAVVAVPKTAVEEKPAAEPEETLKETEEAKEAADQEETLRETMEEKKNEIVAAVKETVSREKETEDDQEEKEEEKKEAAEEAEKIEAIEAEPAEESVTDIISIATNEKGEILINGKATGYRLAKTADAEESEAADAEETEAATEEEAAEEKEEDKTAAAAAEEKTEEKTEEEKEPEEEPVLHEVKIIYVDEEGEEAGTETLNLPEGVHNNPELTLPAETTLVSDPKITVREGNQSRILIVHRVTVYPVELTYIDSTGKVISQTSLELAPGDYATVISQSKGKDQTILPESGYVAVYPKTIRVNKTDNSYDIVVKKGNTCGENAEYDEKTKACVCKLNFEGDPYAKGCTAVPNN